MKRTLKLMFRNVKMRRGTAMAMVAGGLLLAATMAAAPAEATFPGGNGRIAFVRGGNIYTASATGGSIKQVTRTGGLSGPHWSPDGKRLAYRDASNNVYVRTMATGQTIRLGTAAWNTGGPVWSGDGRVGWIATIPNSECDSQAVYTAPGDGSATPSLLFNFEQMGWDFCSHAPSLQIGSWSPDSQSILVTACGSSSADGVGCNVRRLDIATGQLPKLKEVGCDDFEFVECNPGVIGPATFGPKGIKVLFAASGGYGPRYELPYFDTVSRIYSLDWPKTVFPDAANFHQVSTVTNAYDPVASPSGTLVLFTQNGNIMRSGVDATSTPRLLIKNASQADWQSTH
jgi:Tol biopolymer transport system component